MSRLSRLRAQRGMGLIEALVVLLVGTIAMLALYGLVDTSNKLTKQETEVSDVQQSARIGIYELSRIIRQSSVGGLYFANAVLPIANNISGGTFYTDYKDGSRHFIRKGTDVIAVRGILLGERYALSPGDVTCSVGCDTPGTVMTIKIRSTTVRGFVNFPLGGWPTLKDKTRPFYFIVEDQANQNVTIGASTYVVPYYTVGLVNPTSFDTTDPATFKFTMNPSGAGAQKFNATTALAPALNGPVRCGAVEEIRFFVDEGPDDASNPPRSKADTHPMLAQATLDPLSGNYDIQTLVEDVEDFQIAYGVDGILCPTNPACYDGGVSPAVVTPTANSDEWVGNFVTGNEVTDKLPISSTDPKHVDAFINTSVTTGNIAVPSLHSVWISLVVKSTDPDLVYNGPGARGIQILDSTAVPFSDPTATGRPYRRRPVSLAVSLRNYNS
jgi:Type IV Pilus-assembly protein W/Prokaryotic N-terminal methylation motif